MYCFINKIFCGWGSFSPAFSLPKGSLVPLNLVPGSLDAQFLQRHSLPAQGVLCTAIMSPEQYLLNP